MSLQHSLGYEKGNVFPHECIEKRENLFFSLIVFYRFQKYHRDLFTRTTSNLDIVIYGSRRPIGMASKHHSSPKSSTDYIINQLLETSAKYICTPQREGSITGEIW